MPFAARLDAQWLMTSWGCCMRKRPLTTVAVAQVEIDDELDLLADPEEEICPACGSLLLEYEEDDLILQCPVCDRRLG